MDSASVPRAKLGLVTFQLAVKRPHFYSKHHAQLCPLLRLWLAYSLKIVNITGALAGWTNSKSKSELQPRFPEDSY